MHNMKLKGATTVLNKERVFLGLTMKELLTFIQRKPVCFFQTEQYKHTKFITRE